MGQIWIVTVNGQKFKEETGRAGYAIHCAVNDYCILHRHDHVSMRCLSVAVEREDGKPLVISRIVKIAYESSGQFSVSQSKLLETT